MSQFHRKEEEDPGQDLEPPLFGDTIEEPRCKVCMHEARHGIDRLIATGASYAEIERVFGVPRKSVSSHADKHLRFEDGAVRQIIEREAHRLSENYEEGVQGALRRRVFLETALQKGMAALLEGETEIELRDVISVVTLLDKMDSQISGEAVEGIRMQFQSVLQAINEVVPRDLQKKLAIRARELAEVDGSEIVLQAEESGGEIEAGGSKSD